MTGHDQHHRGQQHSDRHQSGQHHGGRRAVPAWLEDPDACDLYVPDGANVPDALGRTEVLGVGCHPDDLELAAAPVAVTTSAGAPWFAGVVCTDGAGSVASGEYAHLTGDEFAQVRRHEQRQAARIGGYGLLVQLGHTSATVKDPASRQRLVHQLADLIDATRPRQVLTHNPCDRHASHVAVTLAVIDACRVLPADARPDQVLGIEVWRGLDWLADTDRVGLPVHADRTLLEAALGAHASQAATKPYAAGTTARQVANAVFAESHEETSADRQVNAVELTALAHGDGDVGEYVDGLVRRFHDELTEMLRALR